MYVAVCSNSAVADITLARTCAAFGICKMFILVTKQGHHYWVWKIKTLIIMWYQRVFKCRQYCICLVRSHQCSTAYTPLVPRVYILEITQSSCGFLSMRFIHVQHKKRNVHTTPHLTTNKSYSRSNGININIYTYMYILGLVFGVFGGFINSAFSFILS